jgi:hypothetical protein
VTLRRRSSLIEARAGCFRKAVNRGFWVRKSAPPHVGFCGLAIMELTLYVLGALLTLLGLAGLLLPALPGLPLIFAGLLLTAWAGEFLLIGVWPLVFIGLLMLVGMGVDFLAGLLGTKSVGASKWAMVGAGLGALIGLFFGLPGLLLGPFVGAIAGELIATDRLEQAMKAGVGAALGMILGGIAKIVIAFMMLGIAGFALLF